MIIRSVFLDLKRLRVPSLAASMAEKMVLLFEVLWDFVIPFLSFVSFCEFD